MAPRFADPIATAPAHGRYRCRVACSRVQTTCRTTNKGLAWSFGMSNQFIDDTVSILLLDREVACGMGNQRIEKAQENRAFYSKGSLMRSLIAALLIVATGLTAPLKSDAQMRKSAIPHLERRGDATQLVVDGNPFLVLGGETRNSSSSDLAFMTPIWPKLRAMNLNTVLVPVAWETIQANFLNMSAHPFSTVSSV